MQVHIEHLYSENYNTELSIFIQDVLCVDDNEIHRHDIENDVQDAKDTADNNSGALGRLVEKLVEKSVLTFDDVKDIVCEPGVKSIEWKGGN